MKNEPRLSICLAVLFAMLSGCSNQPDALIESLKSAESIEFLTIEPVAPYKPDVDIPDLGKVGYRRILGKTEIHGKRQQEWLDGLQAMIDGGDSRYVMACFNPGYAIRDPSTPGDFMAICFECNRIEINVGGKMSQSPLDFSASPDLSDDFAVVVKDAEMRTYMQ